MGCLTYIEAKYSTNIAKWMEVMNTREIHSLLLDDRGCCLFDLENYTVYCGALLNSMVGLAASISGQSPDRVT